MVAVAAAALTDHLRHDLSPAAVPIVGPRPARHPGRRPAVGGSRPVSPASERRRSAAGCGPGSAALPLTPGRKAVLEAALVLSADHELAPSTLAARVAAAFRADPYAVVSTGLGPASGSWRSGSSGAPSEVERLLAEAEAATRSGPSAPGCAGRGASVHGFGMPLYPGRGPPRRRAAVAAGRGRRPARPGTPWSSGCWTSAQARGFPPPNVDLGLGALAFCGEMIPGAGQAIATLGKVAGWLAHAMEEYVEPTRFRTRAAYIGGPSRRRAGAEPSGRRPSPAASGIAGGYRLPSGSGAGRGRQWPGRRSRRVPRPGARCPAPAAGRRAVVARPARPRVSRTTVETTNTTMLVQSLRRRPEEAVGVVDAQVLGPEAAEGVEGRVGGDQIAPPDPEAALDPDAPGRARPGPRCTRRGRWAGRWCSAV